MLEFYKAVNREKTTAVGRVTNCNATESIWEEIAIKLWDTSLSCVLHTGTCKALGWLWVLLNWVKPQPHFPFWISSRQLVFQDQKWTWKHTFHVFLLKPFQLVLQTLYFSKYWSFRPAEFPPKPMGRLLLMEFCTYLMTRQALLYSQLQSAPVDLGIWLQPLLSTSRLPFQGSHIHPRTGMTSSAMQQDCDCFAPCQSSTSWGTEQRDKNNIPPPIFALSRAEQHKWQAKIWWFSYGYTCQQEFRGLEELQPEDNFCSVTKLD